MVAALGSTSVQADTEGQWCAGLNIQFGAKITSMLSVGYRHADVDNDGDPSGADIGLNIGMDGLHSIKLKGFTGNKCAQGELGAGYNFKTNGLLLTGGIQGGHIAGGVDYNMGGGFSPYLGANTISCYDEPNNGIGGGGGYGGYGPA